MKMANRHTYYNKEIRKFTLNLIVIFNSFTDISFLKYITLTIYSFLFTLTLIYMTLTIFRKKIGSVLRCNQLSVAVFVFILSNKGANQLQGKFSYEAAVLKFIFSNFFWNFADLLGQHLKSSLWKIVLGYHKGNKDHTDIL